jgi:RHS repeat-associated protein
VGRFGYTGQMYLSELGLYHYRARVYNPHIGRFLQTDPIGYEDQINLYAYVGNDPMNRTDPMGMYAQGSGWDEKSWKKFDKVQQGTASKMEKNASKMEARADKLDAKGKSGGDELRAGAANLKSGAADLRSTTKVANRVDGATMNKIHGGACAGGAACAVIGGNSITINKDSSIWSATSSIQSFVLGHESLHSGAGLTDMTSTGYNSYIIGSPAERETFKRLKGTLEGANTPDNLMDLVYPRAWKDFL